MACSSVGLAHADTDYFGDDAASKEVTFRVDRSRTTKQRLVIGALFGGAVLFGGAGVLFHLDSRNAADEVGAVGAHTGNVWSSSLEDTRRRGERSKFLAGAGYVLGGAFLVSSIVALIITEPGSDIVGVSSQPAEKRQIPVSLVPLPGGAMVGKAWLF